MTGMWWWVHSMRGTTKRNVVTRRKMMTTRRREKITVINHHSLRFFQHYNYYRTHTWEGQAPVLLLPCDGKSFNVLQKGSPTYDGSTYDGFDFTMVSETTHPSDTRCDCLSMLRYCCELQASQSCDH
ncbi:hypothetical protein M514_27408 [Trichuris suis]|uniref:Uncharacterized protein n=1 Tax=Trichuris suis TaxID=68888 RepID=A0A085MT69_9BILA|nr:hypothetical protein M514_27408 [Trichuris suis]